VSEWKNALRLLLLLLFLLVSILDQDELKSMNIIEQVSFIIRPIPSHHIISLLYE
jgi:hypothetical protein